MKVKDFLNFIDLDGTEFVTLIIPIKEKSIYKAEDGTLSDEHKVILNADEYSLTDVEKYNPYGINPTFIGNINSPYYNRVDVKTSKDEYKYITEENGNIWIVIGF